MKKSFYLFVDSLNILDLLTDEQCGKFLKKCRFYNEWINYDTGDKNVDIAFQSFKNQFDRDMESYEKKCEANRINGLQGGRPAGKWKTQKNPKNPSGYSNNPNNHDKDKDTDNDNNFTDQEKNIIELYEWSFPKLTADEYRHKFELIKKHLINLGHCIEKNWQLIQVYDEQWVMSTKIERIRTVDYKIAIEKSISIIDQKEKYKVKDFWATLRNRIK